MTVYTNVHNENNNLIKLRLFRRAWKVIYRQSPGA